MENLCHGSIENGLLLKTICLLLAGHVLQEDVDPPAAPADHVPGYLLKTSIQGWSHERLQSW